MDGLLCIQHLEFALVFFFFCVLLARYQTLTEPDHCSICKNWIVVCKYIPPLLRKYPPLLRIVFLK